jgi:hypothetical protein
MYAFFMLSSLAIFVAINEPSILLIITTGTVSR